MRPRPDSTTAGLSARFWNSNWTLLRLSVRVLVVARPLRGHPQPSSRFATSHTQAARRDGSQLARSPALFVQESQCPRHKLGEGEWALLRVLPAASPILVSTESLENSSLKLRSGLTILHFKTAQLNGDRHQIVSHLMEVTFGARNHESRSRECHHGVPGVWTLLPRLTHRSASSA